MNAPVFSSVLLASAILAVVLAPENAATQATPSALSPPSPTQAGPIDSTQQPPYRTERAAAQRLAQSFVEQINKARVALALKHIPQTEEAIHAAQATLKRIITPYNTPQFRSAQINTHTGNDDTAARYPYYFPLEVEAGPIAVKTMQNGPFWAQKGIAVSEAEIVYLTLDLKDDKAAIALNAALEALKTHDTKRAQTTLAQLVKDVIRVETAVTIPIDKARDNLALTREFIRAQNYDGARYAFSHATDALKNMENDPRYATRTGILTDMKNEANTLADMLEEHDPSLLSTLNAKVTSWWRQTQP